MKRNGILLRPTLHQEKVRIPCDHDDDMSSRSRRNANKTDHIIENGESVLQEGAEEFSHNHSLEFSTFSKAEVKKELNTSWIAIPGKRCHLQSSPMTLLPGDCIYRVIFQHGDRVLFERLATRPAPKVTLKSSWLVQKQQQQQLTLKKASRKR